MSNVSEPSFVCAGSVSMREEDEEMKDNTSHDYVTLPAYCLHVVALMSVAVPHCHILDSS